MNEKLVVDLEANGFQNDVTKLWCISMFNIETKEKETFTDHNSNYRGIKEALKIMSTAKQIIGHNWIAYDQVVLEKLYNFKTSATLIDTFLMSQLLNFNRKLGRTKGRHSLAQWGEALGVLKPVQEQWEVYEDAMLNRCEMDVQINVRVYVQLMKEFKSSGIPKSVIQREFAIAKISAQQVKNGWLIDERLALRHINFLKKEIETLREKIEPLMPKIVKCPDVWVTNKECNEILGTTGVKYDIHLKEGQRLKKPIVPRYTKAGVLHSAQTKWLGEGVKVYGAYCRVEFHDAKLTQHSEVKKLLFKNGWKPTEWNIKRTAEGRMIRTSAKLTEDSYGSIKGTLGKDIALHATYQHRLNTLQNQKEENKGWLGSRRKDGRIECVPFTLGTATGRMSHKNLVNVPGAKATFGKEMREIFIAPRDRVLVGCDLASAQLRLLAAAMGDSMYSETVITGKEAEGTDVHTVNQKAAGLRTRAQAKTFIYAFLFGAGDNKIGSIVGGKAKDGKELKAKFLKSFPALSKLQSKLRLDFEKSGGKTITAQDGRKIQVDSPHKLLNYLLQGNEAILAKEWANISAKLIEKNSIDCKLLAIMHDEQNFECSVEDAPKLATVLEKAATMAGEHLGFNCRMDGTSKIGETWYDIH
jgi:DNA polymerase-1